MTTFWPRVAAKLRPTIRAMVSIGPPAGVGTIILIGRLGYVWATAPGTISPSAPPAINTIVSRRPTRHIFLSLTSDACGRYPQECCGAVIRVTLVWNHDN